MKKLIKTIFIAAFICSFLNANAQLQSTKWKGNLNLPDPLECLLYFKNDTVNVIYAGTDVVQLRDISGETVYVSGKDSTVIGIMQYKYENNELTIHKVKGEGPCDTASIGKYKIEIKDDKLYITLIHDDCIQRSYLWPRIEPLNKVQ
ncbi:MAG: hypothetical protein ACR2FN_12905 [Chitinophagaceae bacterium]